MIITFPCICLRKVVNLDIDATTRAPVVTVECHDMYAGTRSPELFANIPGAMLATMLATMLDFIIYLFRYTLRTYTFIVPICEVLKTKKSYEYDPRSFHTHTHQLRRRDTTQIIQI